MSQSLPPNFYAEENCSFKPVFMSDDAYVQAVSSMVIVCADILFYSASKGVVYLAKRKSKPLSNWWMIGGRIKAGDTGEQGAVNNIKRETGLEVDPSRLKFLAMNRYFFNNRQQEPQDIACDSLCYTFALDISNDELAMANTNLDKEEYEHVSEGKGFRTFGLAEIKEAGTHPAILDLAGHLIQQSN